MLDLHSRLGQRVLMKEAESHGTGRLEETTQIRQSALRSAKGRHAHEIVLPLRAAFEPSGMTPVTNDATWYAADAHADGWVTFEVYGDPRSFDAFLLAATPVLEGPWFFVRYDVPSGHIRLRVRRASSDEHRVREIVSDVHRLREAGCQSFRQTPYQPEVFRYRGLAMLALCERHFVIDSRHVVEGIAAREDTWTATDLVLMAVAFVDGWRGMNATMLVAFFDELSSDFARESGFDVAERSEIGSTFRALPVDVRLGKGIEPSSHGLDDAFWERWTALDEGSARDLLRSLLHMFVNRRLAANQRRQEAVLYGWLRRLYEARASMERAR